MISTFFLSFQNVLHQLTLSCKKIICICLSMHQKNRSTALDMMSQRAKTIRYIMTVKKKLPILFIMSEDSMSVGTHDVERLYRKLHIQNRFRLIY